MWFRSPIRSRKSAPTGVVGSTIPHGDTPPGCGSKPWRTAACCPAPSRWPRVTIPPWSASASPGPPRPPMSGRLPSTSSAPRPHGGAFHVVRDFSPANAFAWTPMQEGTYDIEVTVKDGYQATETTSAVVTDEVASRVTGSQAVVTPTANPLVALYSVPPSSAETVFVQFAVAGDHPAWRNTDTRAVVPGKSTNVFVAGMLPNTTYEMRHVFSDGTGSAPVLFTTGSIPATLTIPAFTVQQPPGPGSDLDQDMVFHQLLQGNSNAPPLVATDLSGRVTWYYDLSASGFTLAKAGQSLVPGGTLLLNGVDQYTPVPTAPNVLREIDLAGNPVRETNLAAVNAQLAALGLRAGPRLPPRRPAAGRRDHGRARVSRSAPSTSTAPPPITSAKWSWCSTRTSR